MIELDKDLDEYQLAAIKAKENNIYLNANAGAGKTKVVINKIKDLLNNGVNEQDIVVITFTRAAAQEMRSRLKNINNLFIGTIHSYAYYLLIKNNFDCSSLIENKEFDELINKVIEHPQYKERIDYLLLDEAQDSSLLHFNFILSYLRPRHCFFCGDLNQSIFSFNGSKPEILEDLISNGIFKLYVLKYNYRNDREILKFAKKFTRYNILPDISKSVIDNKGIVSNVSNKNLNYIYNLIKNNGNYNKWFILTRTNKDLDKIYSYLKNKIPCDSFKRNELELNEFNEKMKNNSVKILTIHTAKGLENDYVIVSGARTYNNEEKNISYVAATRAKERLYWSNKELSRKQTVTWEE